MAEPPSALEMRRAPEVQNRAPPPVADRQATRKVADRLHEAVRAAGGNKAVADRSGVPLATVNNYVRGRNGMKIEALAALSAACRVSLEWLVSGSQGGATGPSASYDFPVSVAAPPSGLGETPVDPSPAGMNGGIDVHILAKAIEIVAAITGAAGFQDDPKGLARRIATTYAVLIEPDAQRD